MRPIVVNFRPTIVYVKASKLLGTKWILMVRYFMVKYPNVIKANFEKIVLIKFLTPYGLTVTIYQVNLVHFWGLFPQSVVHVSISKSWQFVRKKVHFLPFCHERQSSSCLISTLWALSSANKPLICCLMPDKLCRPLLSILPIFTVIKRTSLFMLNQTTLTYDTFFNCDTREYSSETWYCRI